jgi:hypothetical protein
MWTSERPCLAACAVYKDANPYTSFESKLRYFVKVGALQTLNHKP